MYIYADFKAKIEEEAAPLRCLANRYNLHFCVMLLYSPVLEENFLSALVRCSDRVVELEKGYFAIIFLSNRDDGYVALANKITYEFEIRFFDQKLSIGVGCSCEDGCSDVIGIAIRNLLEAKEEPVNAFVDNF